jgi:hypothetical protein
MRIANAKSRGPRSRGLRRAGFPSPRLGRRCSRVPRVECERFFPRPHNRSRHRGPDQSKGAPGTSLWASCGFARAAPTGQAPVSTRRSEAGGVACSALRIAAPRLSYPRRPCERSRSKRLPSDIDSARMERPAVVSPPPNGASAVGRKRASAEACSTTSERCRSSPLRSSLLGPPRRCTSIARCRTVPRNRAARSGRRPSGESRAGSRVGAGAGTRKGRAAARAADEPASLGLRPIVAPRVG